MALVEMTDEELSEVTGQAGIDLIGALNQGLREELKLKYPSEVTYENLYDLVSDHLLVLKEFCPLDMFVMYENIISLLIAGGLTNMSGIEVGPILEKVIHHHKDMLVDYLREKGFGTLTFKNYEVSASGKIDIKIRL